MKLIPKSGLWSVARRTLHPNSAVNPSLSLKQQSQAHGALSRSPLPLVFPCQTFTFICLDRLHLREAKPLTASFIRMTSLNPFTDIGWVNPAHSLPDWLYYEAQILRVLTNGLFCIWEVPTVSPTQASVHAARAGMLRWRHWVSCAGKQVRWHFHLYY